MKTLLAARGAFALLLSISALGLARPAAADGLGRLGGFSADDEQPVAQPVARAHHAAVRAHHAKAVQLDTIQLSSVKPTPRQPKHPQPNYAKRAPANVRPVKLAAAPAPVRAAARPAPVASEDEGLADLVERNPHRVLATR